MEQAQRKVLGGKMGTTHFYKLVENAIRGDKNAFADIYEQRARQILFRARLFMKSKVEAEDAAQEAVIKMYKNMGQLKDPKRFDYWMHSIIQNECLKMIKRNSALNNELNITDLEGFLPEERQEFLPEKYAESNEMKDLVLEIIETLPAKRQEIIRLSYYDGLQFAEIAALLKISKDSIRSTISKARRDIRGELERRTGKKFEKVRGIMGIPVLSKVFDYQVRKEIPNEQTQSFIQNCRIALESAPPMVPGTVEAPRAASGLTSALKICGIVAVSTVLLATGILFASDAPNLSNSEINSPVSPSMQTEGSYPQQPLSGSDGDLDISGGLDNQPSLVRLPPESGEAAGNGGSAGTGETYDDTNQPDPGATESAADTPQPTNSSAGQAVQYVSTPVSGSLYLKDHDDNVMPPGGYLSGITVSLIDANDGTVASTTTDNNGMFAFSPVSLAYTTEYVLQMTLPESSGLASTTDNPKGRIILSLAPGQGTNNASLYLTYNNPPIGDIVLSGGVCACGHVNPTRITVSGGGSVSWKIIRQSDGGVVSAGTGADVTSATRGLPDGIYLIDSANTDSFGNIKVSKKDFQIYSGEIDPNLFT